jgi:hypothetical protein
MARNFICSKCGVRISESKNQMEKRIEYRRLSDMGRYRVVKVADLCKTCTDAELTSPSAGEAQTMFDG